MMLLQFIIPVILVKLLKGAEAAFCPDGSPPFCSVRRILQNLSFEDLRISEQRCDPCMGRGSVAGGTAAEPDEFSFMVALGWPSADNSGQYDYKCGGALLSPHFIITAAHCAFVNGQPPAVLLPGGPNLTDSKGNISHVSTIFVHPEYRVDSLYHDIAIIRSKEPLGYKTACLWVDYELDQPNLTIIGYGDTKYAGSSSPILLKADLQAVSNEECASFYEPDYGIEDGLITKQLCAHDPEEYRDACQGDSGGPLLMRKCQGYTEIPYVVGITSFGIGCAGEPPSIYTRISEYIDWIEAIVWPNNTEYFPSSVID